MISRLKINVGAVGQDALDVLEEKAERIVEAANRGTSAPVDIQYVRLDDSILIGPTNAADLPVEIGTRYLPARRYFKAALDAEMSD